MLSFIGLLPVPSLSGSPKVLTLKKTCWSELTPQTPHFPMEICFRLPGNIFQPCPRAKALEAPFRYQIFSLLSTPQTWPRLLTETWREGNPVIQGPFK